MDASDGAMHISMVHTMMESISAIFNVLTFRYGKGREQLDLAGFLISSSFKEMY